MFRILKRLPQFKLSTFLTKQPKFMFSGDHHDDHGHHEIDREKIALRNNKSGTKSTNSRILFKSELGRQKNDESHCPV
jgi:hypothetical protein